eukprot:m.35072 g.35072  ORF g.35072 m.35072 type:complete len:156 (+) comp5702_c0_seq3:2053-2520(+)
MLTLSLHIWLRVFVAQAELELLVDDSNDKHFNMKDIVKQERRKKKRKKGADDEEVQPDFEVDTLDPRFQAVFTSSKFNIDPTSSKFIKSKGMEKILEERRRRRGFEEEDAERHTASRKKSKSNGGGSSKEQSTKQLVSAIKARSLSSRPSKKQRL